MNVSEIMTSNVELASPEESIQKAAQKMADLNTGVLPVGHNDRLVGMITDRDIAVRAVAKGLSPKTLVRDIMSKDVKYCFDDQEVDDIVANMGEVRMRRLPVVNRDKRLVGIVSIGDIAVAHSPEAAGQALSGIAT